MKVTYIPPLAMFGGPLEGDSAVRFIFMDETGITKKDDITVVAGVIVHADQQMHDVQRRFFEIYNRSPQKLRERYPIPHAKDILDYELLTVDEWPTEHRMRLIAELMGIVREFELPVAYGIRKRSSQEVRDAADALPKKVNVIQFDHMCAFLGCVSQADKWMRSKAEPHEVATAVHDDNDARKHLSALAMGLRQVKYQLSDDEFIHASNDPCGPREPGAYYITRIRMPVHFAKKEAEPLIQLADVCCFGLRRFYAGFSYGEQFIHALTGTVPERTDFKKGQTNVTQAWI